MTKRTVFLLTLLLFPGPFLLAQNEDVPAVLSHIVRDREGSYRIVLGDTLVLNDTPREVQYSVLNFPGKVRGTEKGFDLDFGLPRLNGVLFIGLIDYAGSRYPLPVYRSHAFSIVTGKVSVDMSVLRDHYDMTGWEESGHAVVGYRVVSWRGQILYDGKVALEGTGPFRVVPAIINGPFVDLLTHNSAVISWDTDLPSKGTVTVGGRTFTDGKQARHHEVSITDLQADTRYDYTVEYGGLKQQYAFHTAPAPGSRKPFVFGYTSDSRGGAGWGERNIHGSNSYMVKKIAALAALKKVAFLQFTGDVISGYRTDAGDEILQYSNFKHALEPFAHYFPVIVGQGNHEVLMRNFADSSGRYRVSVARFPYSGMTTEKLFSEMFVLPKNGPLSEDGAVYDPDPGKQDFPSYEETVYYYTWDNVAVICLNSDYWYTPSDDAIQVVGGNFHGYVMDKQMQWLASTLRKLEKDAHIDHIFVTIHTPFFPNSAHIGDDMWYHGNNNVRPWVAGHPVEKGIIERRDQLLDLLINKSQKVAALLTGDEHNYCKTEIGPMTPIYPVGYKGRKLKLKRTIYQINNGAAGAPYYAKAEVPWSSYTTGFSTLNALCLFHVDGPHIRMEVINPDTFEKIDSLELR